MQWIIRIVVYYFLYWPCKHTMQFVSHNPLFCSSQPSMHISSRSFSLPLLFHTCIHAQEIGDSSTGPIFYLHLHTHRHQDIELDKFYRGSFIWCRHAEHNCFNASLIYSWVVLIIISWCINTHHIIVAKFFCAWYRMYFSHVKHFHNEMNEFILQD